MKLNRCKDHRLRGDIRALKAILPDEYEYTVCEFAEIGLDGGFRTVLRLNLRTEAEARRWLSAFQESSKNTLRIRWIDKSQGEHKKNIFKVILRCQHNTMPRSPTADARAGSKNTNCPLSMTITVKRVITNRKSRSSDIHAGDLPMIVRLQYNHNHLIDCADILKHRDISQSVTEKFVSLFRSGHSPFTALSAHKYDLQEQHGDDYASISTDRFQCPDIAWCHRLYLKTFKKRYEAPDEKSTLHDLGQKVSTYNSNDLTASMTQVGEDICVALCTPLMKRVHHHLEQSSERVFLDSCAWTNRNSCKVFTLLANTCAGGVPLGVLVTTSEAEEVLTEGFRLLKSLFPPAAFFGRNEEGPVVFMTEDSESKRAALGNAFPTSCLLLCSVHILQETWQFLWDVKHKIAKEDRPHLLRLVKHMIQAATPEMLEVRYSTVISDTTARRYACFSSHVQHLYKRRSMWAACYHGDLSLTGNGENAMRITKDQIFLRPKVFNVVQLVDFLSTHLEQYYKQKLLVVANNRLDLAVTSHYLPITDWDLPASRIKQVDHHEFEIPSQKREGVTYHVDMEASVCSCYIGVKGAPCKHQHMVLKHFFLHSINTSPQNSPSLRYLFFSVAMGGEVDDHQFPMLHSGQRDWARTPEEDAQSEFSMSSVSSFDDSDDLAMESEPDNAGNDRFDTDIVEFAEALKEKRKNNPDVFNGPIQAFFRRFNKMTTDAALASALSSFGKRSGIGCSRYHPRSEQVGMKIDTPPTAHQRTSLRSSTKKQRVLKTH